MGPGPSREPDKVKELQINPIVSSDRSVLGNEQRSVDVWTVKLSAPTRDAWAILSVDEHERARRLHDEPSRWRFAAARVALRQVLARYCRDTSAADLRFDRHCRWCGDAEHGKPTVVGFQDLSFSASRSGSVTLIAVGRCIDVGVDIEGIDPTVDWGAVASIAFAREERSLVDSPATAAVLWCRKEAAAKAIGRGLTIDLRSCRVDGPADTEGWRWVHAAPDCAPLAVRDLDLAENHAGALALIGDKIPSQITHRTV